MTDTDMKLPAIVWSDTELGLRVVLREKADQDHCQVELERRDGTDALGVERWRRVDPASAELAGHALLGMAQQLAWHQHTDLQLLSSWQKPDPHTEAEQAYAQQQAMQQPATGNECQDGHQFGRWQRSHRLGNTWRQCQICAATEVRSAQAGREALDPNATGYVYPGGPRKPDPADPTRPDLPF